MRVISRWTLILASWLLLMVCTGGSAWAQAIDFSKPYARMGVGVLGGGAAAAAGATTTQYFYFGSSSNNSLHTTALWITNFTGSARYHVASAGDTYPGFKYSSATGTLSDICVWAKSGGGSAGNIRAAIYDNSKNLLAQWGSEVSVSSTTASWVCAPSLSATPTISSGTNYILGVTADGSDPDIGNESFSTVITNFEASDRTGGFPDPEEAASTSHDGQIVIAEVTVSSTTTPIMYVNAATGASGAGGTDAVSGAQNHTTGNLLVAVIMNRDTVTANRTVSSVTDTAGNTWTLASGTEGGWNFGQGRTEIWYSKNITGNSANVVTATMSGTCSSALKIIVYQFSGASTSSPLDKTAKGAGTTGTTWESANTDNTTANDEVLVAGCGFTGTPAVTLGESFTGWQIPGTPYGGVAAGYKIVSSTGAYKASMTSTTDQYWGCAIATFK